jgi:uroporphyrinogen decarboxylase
MGGFAWLPFRDENITHYTGIRSQKGSPDLRYNTIKHVFEEGTIMNKRDAVLRVIDSSKPTNFIPAAFFLHFDPAYHRGQAAVERHLAYFRYTGMDFVKIQYEHGFPHNPAIQRPADWAKMPFYDLDFFTEPLAVVEGLVKAAKPEALVILTLYSPFMFAGHVAGEAVVTAHIKENPAAVQRGMEIITDSLMGFVKECIRLGLDGFYMSTQGGEKGRLDDIDLFNQVVRPYDLALMDEIQRNCIFNILHVCDYRLPYSNLTPFVDYPGHVVNTNLELAEGRTTAAEVSHLFDRPFMGGLDRLGIIARGSHQDIRAVVEDVLRDAPARFILGADCTVPSDTPWDNLKLAISLAHRYNR